MRVLHSFDASVLYTSCLDYGFISVIIYDGLVMCAPVRRIVLINSRQVKSKGETEENMDGCDTARYRG